VSVRQLRGAPEVVARRLLGAHLSVGTVVVRLTEVEAYGGLTDPASHAFRGKRRANATMFGPAGRLYVYTSYGVHQCMNVTCGTAERPAAVLLRAAEVLQGAAVVRRRRGRDLRGGALAGPGILCQGLGITRADDGTDVFAEGSRVSLRLAAPVRPAAILAGPRVGITKEVERPWRFRLVDPPR
jgi:DNA-3-methyladenine glycosylase